jgi:hypothetical protein
MSDLAQHVIVLLLVLLATGWLVRRAWSTLHPKAGAGCGGCASQGCGTCHASNLASRKRQPPYR